MKTSQLKIIKDLQEQNQFLMKGIVSAKYLLLAAKGPEGGPTSWIKTRKKWLELY